MKIFTIATIKGGTGKTTTAAALLQAEQYDNRRPLAIDLDPQGNLSMMLGADLNCPGAYEFLMGADPAEVIQHTEQGIDVIAASRDLAVLKSTAGSAMRLRDALQADLFKLGTYSACFIDTPPTMGESLYNALMASTDLIIPLEPDTSSLQGLYQVKDAYDHIKPINKNLDRVWVLLTRYDPRPKINRYMHDTIRSACVDMGIPAGCVKTIRPSIAVREAQALQKNLFEYARKCSAAQDYYDLLTAMRNVYSDLL